MEREILIESVKGIAQLSIFDFELFSLICQQFLNLSVDESLDLFSYGIQTKKIRVIQ